jgi:hypothetical protein
LDFLQYSSNKEITPLNKIMILAYQLGESCPIGDLGALINHKRDMELGKITKEKVERLKSQKSQELLLEKTKYLSILEEESQKKSNLDKGNSLS